MKRYFLTLIICQLAYFNYAQWQQQNSGTTKLMKDLYFLSANDGYAVGDNGTILKTTDGGNNWTTEPSPTNSNLNSIQFVDLNTGYIAVQDTFFLKTTDGGNTWNIEQLDTIQQNPGSCFFCMYNLVDFFDSSNGLIVLSEGHLTKAQTLDAGSNWKMETEGLSASFNTAISRPVKDTMYVLDINRKLAKSTDSGNNWTETTLAFGNVLYFDTDFINGKTGFVAGERSLPSKSFINKTMDGGITWVSVLQDSLPNKRIIAMDFDNAGHGMAVGKGIILSTMNYGNDWDVDSLSFPSPGTLFGTKITDAGIFALGSNGTILKWLNNPLGLSKSTVIKDIVRIYPNPSIEKAISIQVNNKVGKYELRLFSVLGEEVFKKELNTSKEIIKFDLASGIYSYRLTFNGINHTGKLILD